MCLQKKIKIYGVSLLSLLTFMTPSIAENQTEAFLQEDFVEQNIDEGAAYWSPEFFEYAKHFLMFATCAGLIYKFYPNEFNIYRRIQPIAAHQITQLVEKFIEAYTPPNLYPNDALDNEFTGMETPADRLIAQAIDGYNRYILQMNIIQMQMGGGGLVMMF